MDLKQILQETKDLVLDTGVLIEYFKNQDQELIELLDEYVFEPDSKISLYGHNLLKCEVYYIKCRKIGIEPAREYVKRLEQIMITISDKWIFEQAGRIKCKYPIALSDCFSMSLSILRECPVFFMPEKELTNDIVDRLNSELGAKIHLVKTS